MLHAGKGRSFGHKNRKPQGGTVTPTPSVGNLINVTSWAQAVGIINTTGSNGDVVNMRHAGYTDDTPRTLTCTKAYNGTGINVIFRATQPVQVIVDSLANACIEFNGGGGSADAVAGNATGSGVSNFTVYVNASSKVAFRGFIFGQGNFSIAVYNSSDVYLENSIFTAARDDLVRLDLGVSRLALVNCLVVDPITQGRMWYKTDGTAPVIAQSDPGGGYILATDPNHNDAFNSFRGACADLTVTGNFFGGYCQGTFFTADFVASQTRVLFDSNTTQVQFWTAFGMDTANDLQITNNTFLVDPAPDPGNSPGIKAGTLRAGGTGKIRVGLNSIPVGSTIDGPYTMAEWQGSVTGDTVTPPTASGFVQTPSNVGNLASVRQRPAWTRYTTPLLAINAGLIHGPGGALSSFSTGDWLTLMPGQVKGRTVNSEASYQFRVRLDTGGGFSVVQGPTTGLAGAVYQANTAGSVIIDYSVDGGSTWMPSNTVTVASAFNSLTTGIGNITYTNSNRTAARNTSDAATIVPSLNGRTAGASATYVYEITPTQVSGGDIYFGLTDGTRRFLINGAAIYGGVIGSESFIGSLTPGEVKDGTAKFTIVWNASTQKIWVKGSLAGWLGANPPGGDPNGAGAGFDISGVGLTGTVKAYTVVTKVGDTGAFNFGQVAFTSPLPANTAF